MAGTCTQNRRGDLTRRADSAPGGVGLFPLHQSSNPIFSPTRMSMSMPPAMAMAMAYMCRSPAHRGQRETGGG